MLHEIKRISYNLEVKLDYLTDKYIKFYAFYM